jgi:hypothetical protein
MEKGEYINDDYTQDVGVNIKSVMKKEGKN